MENKIKLKQLFNDFEISEKKINNYLKEKKIIEIDKNLFLVNNNSKKIINQVQIGTIIFINLIKFLPSKLLLIFIKKNTENIIELKNEKQALNFTYSKKILIESTISNKKKFNLNKNYIVLFENKILGYAEFVKKNGNFFFENKMNIGHYLKESI